MMFYLSVPLEMKRLPDWTDWMLLVSLLFTIFFPLFPPFGLSLFLSLFAQKHFWGISISSRAAAQAPRFMAGLFVRVDERVLFTTQVGSFDPYCWNSLLCHTQMNWKVTGSGHGNKMCTLGKYLIILIDQPRRVTAAKRSVSGVTGPRCSKDFRRDQEAQREG